MNRVLAALVLATLLAVLPLAAAPLTGRVLDAEGRPVAEAVVTVHSQAGEEVALTGRDGTFEFPDLQRGPATVAVAHDRLGQASLQLEEGKTTLEAVLQPASHRDEITVTGARIAADPARIPGSVDVLDRRDLEGEHVLTTGEALRKVAGVNVRDEEGFGLRPNIGIRGLNPTRSSKVLLLEDGIPVTYAPYGDNSSYYHPPVERFESIEVVKGSGQIAWGPSTIGGVINYLTPAPPAKPSVSATLVGGSDEFSDARLSTGGTFGRTGMTIDLMRKEGDGARENVHSLLNDVNAKLVFTATPDHRLTLRGNWYTEDSMVTYSGLRQSEWEADPRANPFKNDSFDGSRVGTSLSHDWRLAENRAVTTTLYASRFRRHWWRQSSNSSQRPNDASDPNCSGMADLNTTCGNEGRLRTFMNWGLESRMAVRGSMLGLEANTDFGVRAHFEDQERLQVNGDTPLARSGRLVEDNERQNDAYSAFVQTRLSRGAWSVTPGVRVEQIDYRRTNRLANGGAGVSGSTDLFEVIPGIGLAWNRGETTFFAGVHRGFAPPRTEDIISNSNGGVVELDPERSWNSELGFRSTVRSGLDVAATIFRMDYENQIVPASIAGGIGATLTNGGETIHQGFELSSRIDTAPLFGTAHNTYAKLAWTWVADAEYAGARFSAIPGAGGIDVSGNRLPYAPEHLLTAGFGYLFPTGADAFIEAVYVGEQFADDLNTVAPTADGQRGLIEASTVLNASFNYPVSSLDTTFFVAVKNILDENYIVDRSRGILPGAPRQVQLGLTFRR